MEHIQPIIEYIFLIIGVASATAVALQPLIKKLDNKRVNKVFNFIVSVLEKAEEISETLGLHKVSEKQKKEIEDQRKENENSDTQ